MGGNNIADVQRITVVADPANANGSAFGGIRAGNAAFVGSSGVVGISAANVAVQDVVTIGDIYATDSASPALSFGSNSQFGSVRIAGGDLLQGNSKAIANSGYNYDVVLAAGETSGGAAIAAANTLGQLSFTQTPASVASAASKSIDLTANIDSGVNYTGGVANDTFNATNVTLTAGDSLVGGNGIDTLSLTLAAAGTYGANVNTSSVEALRITNTAAVTVDATGFAGLKDIYVSANTAAATVASVGSLPNVHLTSATGTVAVEATAAASVGTSDAVTIALNGSGVSSNLALTYNGIETFNVATAGVASGSSTTNVTLASNNLKNVAVTGATAANLAINLAGSGASATTPHTLTSDAGAHDIDLTVATNANVNLGAGDDVLRMSAISASQTITGGDGNDTLVYSGAGTATTTNVTGFETIRITAAGGNSGVAPANTVTFTAETTGTAGSSGLVSGGTVNLELGGTVTLSNTAWSGSADSATVNVGTSAAASNGLNSTVNLTGLESLTVNNNYSATGTAARTVTVDDAAAAALRTISVNSSKSLTLVVTDTTALTTVDASGVAGTFTLAANAGAVAGYSVTAGAGGSTIAGGAGADSLTGGAGADSLTGGAGADSLTGNGGNDTLTGGFGADTMTGGTGTDVFVIGTNGGTAATNSSSSAAPDVIKDFVSGTDKLDIAQTPVTFLGNFTNIQQALAAQTGGTANAAAFVTGENQLYVFSLTTGALAANDTVIKLEGVSSVAAGDLLLGSQNSGASISLTATGQKLSLTDGISNGTGTSAVTRYSTINNDTISANIAYLGAGETLDGAAGSDTLAISIAAISPATSPQADATKTLPATVTNIENITFASYTPATSAANDRFYDVVLSAANVGANSTLNVTNNNAGTKYDGTSQTAAVKFNAAALGATSSINYIGSAGNDSVTGGAGNDSIDGGAGDDTIVGGAGTNSLTGGAGNDQITTSSATDYVDAGGNNDAVISALGAAYDSKASLLGGTGVLDTLTLVNGDDIAAATVTGFENLTITSGASVTMTLAQLSQFSGTITAAGTETLNISGAGGNLTRPTAIEVVSAANATSAMTITSTGSATITGSGSDDTITSTEAGAINIVGGNGNDTIKVDAAHFDPAGSADIIAGGGGTADRLELTGDTGNYVNTWGTASNVTQIETIEFKQMTKNVSVTTVDALIASGATLTVTTTQTTGTLTFNAGAELDGKVNVTGGGANDSLTGGAGADTLTGGNGDDVLTGNAGNDSLTGGAGSDSIYGGAGNDSIDAGDGNNLVSGGVGSDTITLGIGSNSILLGEVIDGATTYTDKISGFTTGATADGGDVIEISAGDLDAAGGTSLTLSDGTDDIVSGEAVVIGQVSPGTNYTIGATVNVVQVTGTTGTSLESALNGAVISGGAGSYLIVYFDADLDGGSMVVAIVTNDGTPALSAAEIAAAKVVATVPMTAAQYAGVGGVGGIGAGNFRFGP